nr:S-layer family protein [Hydrococcus sp. Prado102]
TNNLFLADTGQIGTFVSNGAIGKGGNLTVAAQRLFVASGARIGSTTSGAGNGGNVRIVADEITVTGRIPQTPSAITTVVDLTGTGRGGDLKVETDRLQVLDGAAISAGTFGIGDSGNLTITAKEEIAIADGISFIGTTVFSTSLIPPELLPRDLTSANIGRGGDLTVETKRLQITNGGLMGTGTLGVGDSGDLLVRASESIEISGVRNTPGGLFSSRIFSSAEDGSTGNGGNLTIETPTLRIFDGGQVRSSTNGVGKAGNIRIDTRSLELFGISGEGELPSSIDAASTSNGMAGSIAIDTTDLTVRDGAEISVSGRMGGAGNLVINADRILLDNEAKLSAEVAGGDRGNININSDLLLLRRGSQITTNALGDSSGGNIAIDTNFLIALPQENSDITANAQQSFGGRATISATGIFGIVSRQRLTPLSDITASSDLGTEFSGTVEIINPNVVSTSATVKLPSEIVEMSDRIVASCPADKGNTFVVSGRGGIPENPTQSLRGQSVWQDWRSLSEYEYKSEFSSSSPRTPAPAQIVEAQGWILNNNGKVQLIAQNSAANPQGFWKQTPNCNKY